MWGRALARPGRAEARRHIETRRSPPALHRIVDGLLADEFLERVAIALRFVTHPLHKIADRHSGIGDLVCVREPEDVHQRLIAAVTPSHDADAFRVNAAE